MDTVVDTVVEDTTVERGDTVAVEDTVEIAVEIVVEEDIAAEEGDTVVVEEDMEIAVVAAAMVDLN